MSYHLYGFIEVPSEQREREGEAPMALPLEGATRAPIIEAKGKKDFGAVFTQTYQNIAAVIGKPLHEILEGLSKEKLIQALLEHQQTLENIMKVQFILPCKFGTILKDDEEVKKLLAQNNLFLSDSLKKMENHLEMDVLATWDVQDILKEMVATDPEIAKLKMDFQSLPLAEQEKNKLALGVRLQTKLKEKGKEYAQQIVNKLKEKATSYALHDVMNDTMVFNASFLLYQWDKDSFFKALEDLDKHFEGKLHFKCVGPLPPHSFATIQVKRFVLEEILKAKQTLGLNGETDLKGIKQAYKLKARACHPDTHPEFSQKEFETIHQAYKMLTDYYQGDAKPIQLFLLDASKELR